MAKTDEILSHVISIKEDLAGIKEHLRQLNGKVAKHELDIENNRCKVDSINLRLAKYAGGLAVFFFLLDVGLRYLIQ